MRMLTAHKEHRLFSVKRKEEKNSISHESRIGKSKIRTAIISRKMHTSASITMHTQCSQALLYKVLYAKLYTTDTSKVCSRSFRFLGGGGISHNVGYKMANPRLEIEFLRQNLAFLHAFLPLRCLPTGDVPCKL